MLNVDINGGNVSLSYKFNYKDFIVSVGVSNGSESIYLVKSDEESSWYATFDRVEDAINFANEQGAIE